jgi:hypothetical protein
MLSSILPDKPPFIATPPRKTPSWHKRSCAALLGATTLMSVSLSGPAITPAAAQQPQKPNIIFIMGDEQAFSQVFQMLIPSDLQSLLIYSVDARCSCAT